MMKVVMIGPFGMTVKSTMRERALPMAKALVRRGHQVTIIVPPWDSPAEAGYTMVDDGVRIINTLLPKGGGLFYHLQLTAGVVRTALALEPDIIHLFKPKAYAGLAHTLLYTLRQLRRQPAKLIVDEDDWEIAWNEINDYPPLQKRFFRWQEPWGLKHADRVTVASRALQRLVETLDVPRYKIYYVPNGVRPMPGPLNILRSFSTWQEKLAEVVGAGETPKTIGLNWAPQDLAAHQSLTTDFSGKIRTEYDLLGKPVILLYTRFFEFQLELLLQVMAKVNQFLPETRWLVVGKGYFGEEKHLVQWARAQGLAEKLVSAGWVPQETLPHYFAAANVALYPYDDTLLNRTKCSVKLLDLLSAGVPVVASRVGQNIEYIIHGKTGVLVPPHDKDTMADMVLHILQHRTMQQLLGHEAARYVNRVFRWDTLVESVEAAYNDA